MGLVRRKPPELAPVRLQGVFSQALDQPRFGDWPDPFLDA